MKRIVLSILFLLAVFASPATAKTFYGLKNEGTFETDVYADSVVISDGTDTWEIDIQSGNLDIRKDTGSGQLNTKVLKPDVYRDTVLISDGNDTFVLDVSGDSLYIRKDNGSGTISTQGDDLTSDGGEIETKGGDVSTNGGQLNTNGGQLNTNGGQINTNGGNLDLGGGDINNAPDILSSNNVRNFVDPDGLVMDTGTSGSDSDVQISTGTLYVDYVGDGETSPRLVEYSSSKTANPDTALNLGSSGCGGVSSRSPVKNDRWYELVLVADKNGNKDPCVIAFAHTSSSDSTPTKPSHLPSGYELARDMGSPGKTWWLRTDGSSNIHSFNHQSNGLYLWTESTLSNFSTLINTASPTTGSNQTLDISVQVPPTKINIKINKVGQNSGGASQSLLGLSHQALSSPGEAQAVFDVREATFEGHSFNLKNIEAQTINWYGNSNLSFLQIDNISSFKAVN